MYVLDKHLTRTICFFFSTRYNDSNRNKLYTSHLELIDFKNSVTKTPVLVRIYQF